MLAMADGDIEVIARLAGALLDDDVVATLADETALGPIRETLSELVDPEFECVMVAPDYVGRRGRRTYRGPNGFIEAWRDWLEAYATYTIEIGELTVGPEGRVLTLGTQRGTTRTGGVEVSEPAAAVWTLRGGKLVRAEFHLDPDAARRAAGVA
jgi:ketosteroid isomerase-like protein